MVRAKHYIIRGRVQGVGYRFFALRSAEHRGIRGYVRNLPDGAVEAHAQGDEADLGPFKADLRRGPEMAHVNEIVETDAAVSDAYLSFSIRG